MVEIILIILISLPFIAFKVWIDRKSILTPKDIGDRGEDLVNYDLSKLDQTLYNVYNDINIPNTKAELGLAQIDHIVVSVFGIFVIETKNYTGWIFCSPERKYWTQVVYSEKNKLYNPIKQNWGHIYALSDFLQIPRNKFKNIVCFVGDAEFKTDIPADVFTDSSYIDYITTFKNNVLTEAEVESINSMLSLEEESE
ncbi:MAG: nuclease [Opitutales bacterium]|nr:nuclease [Opitutales bacterium]